MSDEIEIEEFGPLKARYIIGEAAEEYDDGEGGTTQIFEGEIPDDDDAALAQAVEIVEMALDAQKEGWESQAIDAVIEAYEVDEDDLVEGDEDEEGEGESEEEEAEPEDDGEEEGEEDEPVGVRVRQGKKTLVIAGQNLDQMLSAGWEVDDNQENLDGIGEVAGGEEDEGDEGEGEEEAEAMKPPWRGFDGRNVKQLSASLPKKTDEELAYVYEYEKANKDRDSIIKLLESLAAERQEEAAEEEGEGEEETNADGLTEAEEEAIHEENDTEPDDEADLRTEELDDEDFDAEHLEVVQKVIKKIDTENLFVPDPLPEDVIELPFDLTDCSNTEIRKLHGAFNAYSARAAYVLMIEEQCERSCGYIAEQKMAEYIDSIEKIDEETKKPKSVTALEAEAKQDETVSLWLNRKHEHGSVAIAMRKERDMYDKTVTVLSREWTMRSEEFQHSGGLSNRSSKKKSS